MMLAPVSSHAASTTRSRVAPTSPRCTGPWLMPRRAGLQVFGCIFPEGRSTALGRCRRQGHYGRVVLTWGMAPSPKVSRRRPGCGLRDFAPVYPRKWRTGEYSGALGAADVPASVATTRVSTPGTAAPCAVPLGDTTLLQQPTANSGCRYYIAECSWLRARERHCRRRDLGAGDLRM